MTDGFLFGVFPYLAVALAVVGIPTSTDDEFPMRVERASGMQAAGFVERRLRVTQLAGQGDQHGR